MPNSLDWFWRFSMGLPPRPQDREFLTRIAPELFDPNRNLSDQPERDRGEWEVSACGRSALARKPEVLHQPTEDDERPFRIVREGTCPQPDCPLKLGGHNSSSGSPHGKAAARDGTAVFRLMSVAGGLEGQGRHFFRHSAEGSWRQGASDRTYSSLIRTSISTRARTAQLEESIAFSGTLTRSTSSQPRRSPSLCPLLQRGSKLALSGAEEWSNTARRKVTALPSSTSEQPQTPAFMTGFT